MQPGAKMDSMHREKKRVVRASFSKESKESRLVRTQIQLTRKQSTRMKAAASSRSLSVSELIRRAVETLLNSAGPVDLEEKRRRAIAAAGRFRSGLNDLAENHDKYLDRDFSGGPG
jgi:hypothetical protein